ncbi:MAG: hypothetical protein ABW321_04850 [Polyangiales bacterium]
MGLVHGLDLAVVALALACVLLVPVTFLVPFNDEWLRINYLADHSVWEWTVMHTRTWVVRPTAELIMAFAALPNTRPALAHDFTPAAFLAAFHRVYVWLALVYGVLLYANAVLLSGRWLPREELTLLILGVLACWLCSDELGHGFYWIDGYGNVLMPFVLLMSGLGLLARSRRVGPSLAAAGLITLAALGHEVLCIYAIGVLALAVVLRRPKLDGWPRWSTSVGLLLVCGLILGAQLFSAGPGVRNANYETHTGVANHYDVALQNVLQINPLRGLLCIITPIFGVAIYRDQLAELLERAVADFRRARWFWVLLVLGTLLTCVLPLASVGLKKGRVTVALYSTLTHLMLVVVGVVLCPLLDKWSARWLRGYRQRIGSVLPIALLLLAASGNRGTFREAIVKRAELQGQAVGYMTQLFEGKKRVLQLCRPKHPYVKSARNLTDNNEAIYFKLEKVRHRCPK